MCVFHATSWWDSSDVIFALYYYETEYIFVAFMTVLHVVHEFFYKKDPESSYTTFWYVSSSIRCFNRKNIKRDTRVDYLDDKPLVILNLAYNFNVAISFFICIVEDIIDELVVGEGKNDNFILTSSHPGETLEEVIEFARSLSLEYEGEVQVVEF